MLNNIGLPGLVMLSMFASAGLNPVPTFLFAALMGGTVALGMN